MPDIVSSSFDWSVRLAPGTYTISVWLTMGPCFEHSLEVRADDPLDRVVEIELP
jgi:hypothetical protein